MAKVRLSVEFENGVLDVDPAKDPVAYVRELEKAQDEFTKVVASLDAHGSTLKLSLPETTVVLDVLGDPAKVY